MIVSNKYLNDMMRASKDRADREQRNKMMRNFNVNRPPAPLRNGVGFGVEPPLGL